MRVQVNLASRPFVELRPFFLRLRLGMAGLALLGVGLAIGAHALDARAVRQQAELDQLRNQTIAAQNSRIHTEQRLRDPVNARILDRAHFLNALFLGKSFSWTAVMMDLEDVLPNGVQVTSIEPQVSPDGDVAIRLRVAGERANAVQLVRNLERSHRFLHARLTGEASQLKEGNTAAGARPVPTVPLAPAGVEFDILAEYVPLPANEPFAVGHGRPVASSRTASANTASGQTMAVIPVPAALRAAGNRPSTNLRKGYPADGVRLRPYAVAPANTATPGPAANTQGGVPR